MLRAFLFPPLLIPPPVLVLICHLLMEIFSKLIFLDLERILHQALPSLSLKVLQIHQLYHPLLSHEVIWGAILIQLFLHLATIFLPVLCLMKDMLLSV